MAAVTVGELTLRDHMGCLVVAGNHYSQHAVDQYNRRRPDCELHTMDNTVMVEISIELGRCPAS